MTTHRALTCTIVLVLAVMGALLRAQSSYDLFQKALATERADGNLREAIQLYERVVKQYPGDRALAARALLRMADCYQKLGDAEAVRILQQVVRDYADQPESAAIARARLGDRSASATPGMTVRQIVLPARAGFTVPFVSTVSPDGRSVPYVDYTAGGDLVLRDLVTGLERRITSDGTSGTAEQRAGTVKSQYVEGLSFSRDGRQLAYSWFNGDRYELRLVSLQGSGLPSFRRVVVPSAITWLEPHDWTPDGKSVLASLFREDRTLQIGLIRVADGSLQILKSVHWRGPTRMFVSPDGNYVAYDLPADDRGEQRDIFALALDGSREVAVVVNPADDIVMGWSPDGRHVLFASDRNTGSTGLFAVAYTNAGTIGQPQLIKADIGRAQSMGITPSGVFYFAVNSRSRSYFDVKIAGVDFETGRVVTEPVAIGADRRASNTDPVWSPDGQHVLYTSMQPTAGEGTRTSLVIHSRATGQTRELRPELNQMYAPDWSPDGGSLVTGGQDFRGRWGVYRIDVASGALSRIVDTDAPAVAAWSKDGASIYYRKRLRESREWAIVSRNLESGAERELIRRADVVNVNVSPDGRYIVTRSRDVNPRTQALSAAVLLIPTAGGEPRELIRADDPQNPPTWLRDNGGAALGVITWAPDSRSVLVYKFAADPVPTMEFWRVSLNGGASKLDWPLRMRGQPSVHPDGRQLVFMSPAVPSAQSAFELWAIENVLPRPASSVR